LQKKSDLTFEEYFKEMRNILINTNQKNFQLNKINEHRLKFLTAKIKYILQINLENFDPDDSSYENIVFIGDTSSGKSTIINILLGNRLILNFFHDMI